MYSRKANITAQQKQNYENGYTYFPQIKAFSVGATFIYIFIVCIFRV